MNLSPFVFCTQVTSDLFDIMSGQTDVDHPLCEECTDTLLDHLDTQLNITENECQNYKCVIIEPLSLAHAANQTYNISSAAYKIDR